MNKLLWGCASLILVMTLHSCSLLRLSPKKKDNNSAIPDTTKVVSETPHNRILLPAPDSSYNNADTTGMMKKLVDMVLPVFNNRLQYTTFSGKAKVHFESPDDKQDFTANIRLKKDAAIWIDITALGGMFHAARVYITPDSFFMINYQQKSVSKVALKDVAKILPTQVDFQSMQHLITGEPLREGSIRNVAPLEATWLLQVADDNYRQELEYRKKDSVLLNNQVNTVAPNGPQAMLRYDNFDAINDRKIATSRSVTIQNGADRFLLEMEIEDPAFEKEFEMPFNVPKNYSVK
jgi:hypothetical protein